MQTRDYKADCVLVLDGREFAGLAHVIEVEYDQGTTFINFTMQSVFDSLADLKGVARSKQRSFHLPDGRRASVCPPNIAYSSDFLSLTGAGVLFDDEGEER